jgi:hypothetical protein
MPVQGNTSSLDLPVGDPHPVHGDQGIVAKDYRISPGSVPGHVSPLYLAVFYTFRTQHD